MASGDDETGLDCKLEIIYVITLKMRNSGLIMPRKSMETLRRVFFIRIVPAILGQITWKYIWVTKWVKRSRKISNIDVVFGRIFTFVSQKIDSGGPYAECGILPVLR